MTLNEPLPLELTGRHHGRLTRYRRFPVFSPAWARGRVATFSVLALLVLAVTLGPLLSDGTDDWPQGGVVHLLVQLFLPILAGPWLGTWVRQRGWPAAREGAALALAIGSVTVAVLAFHAWLAEPVKQWVAEQTGRIDDKGQRKKVVMSIGVVVKSADKPASGASGSVGESPAMSRETRLINGAFSVAFSFWLAGGAALWGWRRERFGLAALAQESALAVALAQRREAELKLSVLAAQVEPHFLFNTLAGVRSAIATDPAHASAMIDHLVDYLRAAIPRLRSDGSAQATVGGQFEIVRAYLGLMAARLPRLQVDVHAPADLLTARCPPLMLISLAENAVKHGVEMKLGPARVEVRAARSADGRLALSVLDDGVGFEAAATPMGAGLGLSNIRERLQALYGNAASLTLRNRGEGGMAAVLLLPLELPA